MNKSEHIEIHSDEWIPIKATSPKDLQHVKRVLQKRCESLQPNTFEKEQKKYRDKVEAMSRLPNGGIVGGKLTEEEQKALRSGDCKALRRCALKRQRAMQKKRER